MQDIHCHCACQFHNAHVQDRLSSAEIQLRALHDINFNIRNLSYRLALQLIVVQRFANFTRSNQYFPVSGLGNLRLPWPPVAKDWHGGLVPYHRKVISQQLGRLVARSDQQLVTNHHEHNRTECARVLVCGYGIECCCVESCSGSVCAVSYCVCGDSPGCLVVCPGQSRALEFANYSVVRCDCE